MTAFLCGMTQVYNPSRFNFQALSQQLDQMVFAYNIHSQIFLYFNPAFEDIFGLTQESFTDPAKLLSMVHSEDQAYVTEIYEELVAGAIKKKLEFRFLLADQSLRWLRVKPLVLQDVPGQKVIAGLAEDITEWRHLSDIETKYSNKKNAILQILSHDLAGPLANIQSLSSLVKARFNPTKTKI